MGVLAALKPLQSRRLMKVVWKLLVAETLVLVGKRLPLLVLRLLNGSPPSRLMLSVVLLLLLGRDVCLTDIVMMMDGWYWRASVFQGV